MAGWNELGEEKLNHALVILGSGADCTVGKQDGTKVENGLQIILFDMVMAGCSA